MIAEVKRASPSAGVIAESFDPVEIARCYEAAGANAISVLTDERFFQGHLDHLVAVREAVNLPVLRKDFVLEDVQIYEAAASGADAVLLIVAALTLGGVGTTARRSHCLSSSTRLWRVHTLEEMDRALATDATIIGINNRDLTTFRVNLATTENLSEQVPPGVLLVSESGIRTAEDSRRVRACGVEAILVGEALMRSADVAAQAAELRLASSPGFQDAKADGAAD